MNRTHLIWCYAIVFCTVVIGAWTRDHKATVSPSAPLQPKEIETYTEYKLMTSSGVYFYTAYYTQDGDYLVFDAYKMYGSSSASCVISIKIRATDVKAIYSSQVPK